MFAGYVTIGLALYKGSQSHINISLYNEKSWIYLLEITSGFACNLKQWQTPHFVNKT